MVIDDVLSSPKLTVSDTMVYLTDLKYSKTFVYSKLNGKKITEFGQRGEGPAEFRAITGVYCLDDGLCISEYARLGLFSPQGKLRKELRTTGSGRDFMPFGNRFIGSQGRYFNEEKGNAARTYFLFDSSLQKKKEIATFKYQAILTRDKGKEPMVFFMNCRKAFVYKDRLYVAHTDLGFYIAVFNSAGQRLYEIKKDYKKVAVTDAIKERITTVLKQIHKDSYPVIMARRELYFPDYFPAFQDFYIHNDKIFIFEYPKPGAGGRVVVQIMGLNGNLLAQKTIPFDSFFKMLEEQDYISFCQGYLYFLFKLPNENHKLVEFNVSRLSE